MSTPFRLVWLATLMFFVGYYALNIPVPLYLKSISMPDWLVGVILSANVVASVIMRPFAGILSDTWGRKPVMMLGAAALLIGAGGFGLTTDPIALFVLRVFQVIGYVAFTTASFALAADLAAPEKRGAAIAMLGSGANLAMTFTPLLISGVMTLVPLNASLWLPAAMAVIAALAILRVSAASSPRAERGAFGDIFVLARKLWRPLLTIVLMGMAWGAFFQFTPLLAGRRGLGAPALYYSAYGVFMLTSRLTIGRRLDVLPRTLSFVAGFILLALGLAVMGLAHLPWVALLGVFLLSLPCGVLHPLLGLMHVEQASAGERGRASSVYFMGWDVGIGLGALALAPVLEVFNVQGLFLAAAGLALLALGPAWLATRSRRTT
jgi:MFS family permease